MIWDKVKINVVLAPHTSWLVGGVAEFFYEPTSIEDLACAQKEAQERGLPLTILGGGSNVLVSDHGIKGLVISLAKFSGITMASPLDSQGSGMPVSTLGTQSGSSHEVFSFWALSGTPKSELLKIFLKHKLDPALFLAGLPGQVGGGVVMNAGVSEKLVPREFYEIVENVEVLRPDGSLKNFKREDLKWDYRHCSGWQPGIITRVKITWPDRPRADVVAEVKALNQQRLKKQPLEFPSCGSVFRNPLPLHAGKLIEEAGLKGFSIGDAQVSEKHANFIVNKGRARASDIKKLMDLCRKKVKEHVGVELISEVVCLGEF